MGDKLNKDRSLGEPYKTRAKFCRIASASPRRMSTCEAGEPFRIASKGRSTAKIFIDAERGAVQFHGRSDP
jgi:hypothetical protein